MEKTPEEIEKALDELVPPDDWPVKYHGSMIEVSGVFMSADAFHQAMKEQVIDNKHIMNEPDKFMAKNQGKQAYLDARCYMITHMKPYVGPNGRRLTIIKRTKEGLIYCQDEDKFLSVGQRYLVVEDKI